MKLDLVDEIAYRVVRGATFILHRLPEPVAYGFGSFLGGLVFYFSGRRRVAYADLKAAFGERFTERERWKVVRDHYRHLGQCAVEICRFPLLDRASVGRDIRVHQIECFYEAIEKKKGAILLGAHLGNFELPQIISGILNFPIYGIALPQKHRRLDAFLNDLRRVQGSVFTGRGMGIRDFLRALRRQKMVGMLGDQSAGRRDGVILPLFGRKTTVPTGAFELASKTGAVLLPCFIVRRDKSCHEIFVKKPILCPSEDQKNGFEKQVKTYLQMIEELIREHPSQWLWSKKTLEILLDEAPADSFRRQGRPS